MIGLRCLMVRRHAVTLHYPLGLFMTEYERIIKWNGENKQEAEVAYVPTFPWSNIRTAFTSTDSQYKSGTLSLDNYSAGTL
jgi:hypothetical protein